MSYDAWGDDDINELPDGCWNEMTVKELQDAIMRLFNEPLYEDGKMLHGVSERFLCRMQALKYYAHLEPLTNPIIADAHKIIGDDF